MNFRTQSIALTQLTAAMSFLFTATTANANFEAYYGNVQSEVYLQGVDNVGSVSGYCNDSGNFSLGGSFDSTERLDDFAGSMRNGYVIVNGRKYKMDFDLLTGVKFEPWSVQFTLNNREQSIHLIKLLRDARGYIKFGAEVDRAPRSFEINSKGSTKAANLMLASCWFGAHEE